MTPRQALIDPAVLTAGCHLDDVDGSVRLAMDASRLTREWGFQLSSASGLVSGLQLDGVFPLPNKLRAKFEALSIDHLSVDAVATVLYQLFDRISQFEDQLGLIDVLIEHQECTPAPRAGSGSAVEEQWTRLLDLAALAVSHGKTEKARVLATSSRTVSSRLEVSASLEACVCSTQTSEEDYCPCEFSAELELYNAASSFLLATDPVELLSSDTTNDGVRAAIGIRVMQLGQSLGVALTTDVPAFSLGKDFISSLETHRIPNDAQLAEKFLRAASEVLLGVNLDKSHDLRSSRSGSSPAIKRGNAIARRRDLDREYHLHYWAPTTRGIEFASVVPHSVMKIPDLQNP